MTRALSVGPVLASGYRFDGDEFAVESAAGVAFGDR